MNSEQHKFVKEVNRLLAVLFRSPPKIGTGITYKPRRELIANAIYNGQSYCQPYAGWRKTGAYKRLVAMMED